MANDHGAGYWLTRRAALAPGSTAIVHAEGRWSYADLNDRANRLAHALRDLGVCHGDRVAYLDLNHPDFFVTLFAAAKLGAVFVPLNFRLTAPELTFIVNDAGVHTLVHDASFDALVERMRPDLCCRHHIRRAGVAGRDAGGDGAGPAPGGTHDLDTVIAAARGGDLDTDVGADEVALIMYTSGTTGRPKGAMLTHANVLWNNIQAWIAYDTSTHDITLVCAPLFHIGGLNVTPLAALVKGATVVLMRQFDPAAALRLIAEHRVTTMFGVPAMFQFMALAPGFADSDLSSATCFVCGGAPVPEHLIRLYAERGVPFVQGYGLTETSPFVTIVPIEAAASKIGSAGLPPFFTDVRLLGEDGADVGEPGARGEIVVRGPQVMKGYWNRPDATAEAIRDGWFHTGDIGTWDADGFLYVVDRKKDMIVTGGENVYPAEVEDVLYAHPDIAEAAVIGVADSSWGEAVLAVVVRRGGADPTAEQIIGFCQDRLARYKQPRRVVFVDALPRNPAGKVLKFDLRERFGAAGPTAAAPRA